MDATNPVIYWVTDASQYSRKYASGAWEDVETIETLTDDFEKTSIFKEYTGRIDISSVTTNSSYGWRYKRKTAGAWQDSVEWESRGSYRAGPMMLDAVKS